MLLPYSCSEIKRGFLLPRAKHYTNREPASIVSGKEP
jgi:hypothetical protein